MDIGTACAYMPSASGDGRSSFMCRNNFGAIYKSKRKQSTIICQIADPEITVLDLQKMMEAGMNVVKMKRSSFSTQDRLNLLQKVNTAQKICCQKNNVSDWPIATCIDLKTCTTKTGILENEKDKIYIPRDSQILLTCRKDQLDKCNEKQIFIDSLYLTKNVTVGNLVSIGEDEIILKCIENVDVFSVKCIVIKDGELGNIYPMHLKGATYHEPLLSEKDYEILEFAATNQVDVIMVNFARHVNCIKEIKSYVRQKHYRPMIIVGVATPLGIENFEEIVKESDAIIISREHLEFEMEHSKKSHLLRMQKWMGAICQKIGKQYIMSGGIFAEGLKTGVPTESEVFEFTNALLDGASGFVLNDCEDFNFTAQALQTMEGICRNVEPMLDNFETSLSIIDQNKVPVNAAKAAAVSCVAMSLITQAKAIIIPTVSGTTVKLVLSLKPNCTVYTVSTSERVKKKLSMLGNVIPLIYKGQLNLNFRQMVTSRIDCALEFAVNNTYMTYGDTYVTLERANEISAYCDMCCIRQVEMVSKSKLECPSDANFFASNICFIPAKEDTPLHPGKVKKKGAPRTNSTRFVLES